MVEISKMQEQKEEKCKKQQHEQKKQRQRKQKSERRVIDFLFCLYSFTKLKKGAREEREKKRLNHGCVNSIRPQFIFLF